MSGKYRVKVVEGIMITRNSVKCHKCNDEIESKSRHDFVFCSCGNIAVDGGKDYLKRVGNGLKDESFTDTSAETSKPIKRKRECLGHEGNSGATMGMTIYCDGSCR